MGKVDPREHGGGESRKPLTPDVLDNADVAVLTVKDARTGVPTGDGRKAAFLTFADAPTDEDGQDYVLWLNKTDLTVLVERLGDDDEDWPGQRVPVQKVRVTNPKTGKPVSKYHVVPEEEWDDALGASRKRGTRGKPKKAKAKR